MNEKTKKHTRKNKERLIYFFTFFTATVWVRKHRFPVWLDIVWRLVKEVSFQGFLLQFRILLLKKDNFNLVVKSGTYVNWKFLLQLHTFVYTISGFIASTFNETMRFYTLEYFRFNLQICNKAWLDCIKVCIENFVYVIKKNFENIRKCMVLKKS